MSQSLPSKEALLVDVPEIKWFDVEFKYNFFVSDERVTGVSAVNSTALLKKNVADDAYVQYLETKVPRYVKLSWNRPRLSDFGNQVLDDDVMMQRHKTHSHGTFIADNYKKLVTEETFSALDFIATTFHDGDIDNKIYDFISGTYQQITLDKQTPADASPQQVATTLKTTIGALTNSTLQNNVSSLMRQISGVHHVNAANSSVKSDFFESLKNVSMYAQVNNKFFHDMSGRCIADSQSPYTVDMCALHKITSTAKPASSQAISESEFMSIVPYVGIIVNNSSFHKQRKSIELIGYVIDKYEQLSDGTYKQHKPIIIEDIDKQTFIDVSVKYDSTYCYAIRTIALFNVPAIDSVSGDIATIQVLFASKQVKRYVQIYDNVAPPPPSDIGFTWNYETNKLLVHWSFPPNPQRDIKKFQVFRRASIDNPFELLREYDFDDSDVKTQPREDVIKSLSTQMTNPMTTYIDDDFTTGSKYTYTVCSIDAHGLTSCYGAQFEVSFDVYKNVLKKRLVSHSGAPKPYPNLYVEGNGFVDVMRVSGESSKRMTVIFTPQFYAYEDDNGRTHQVLQTNQNGGCYKLQFINLDNQKGETLTINVDDKIKIDTPSPSMPKFVQGAWTRRRGG